METKRGSFTVFLEPQMVAIGPGEKANLTITVVSSGYTGKVIIATPNANISRPRLAFEIPGSRERILNATVRLIVPVTVTCLDIVYRSQNVSVRVSVYGNYGRKGQFSVCSNAAEVMIAGKAGPEPSLPPVPSINATNLRVLWSLDLSSLPMTQAHHSSPTVADVDGDGRNEILLGYRERFWGPSGLGENRVLCATDSGKVKWVWPPLDQPQLPGHPMTTPTIADLDGDGRTEILIGRRGGALHCLDGQGRELWNFTMNGSLGSVTGEPQLYDNDGDGHPEIYFVAGASSGEWAVNQGQIIVLSSMGQLLWSSGIDGFAGWPLVVWDINQDGAGEIVACLNNNNVVCYAAANASEIWRFPILRQYCDVGQCNEWLESNPVAADVDKDQRYEMLVAGQDGDFYVLNADGELEWKFQTTLTTGSLAFTFPLGDIDDDGNLETCFMDDELVYCIDLFTHEMEWSFKPAHPDHYSNYNTFADVTGDGEIDVLVVASSLYILSNKGKVQAAFDTSALLHDERAENGMWSGDLNGDGLVEILVKFDGDALYCLTTGAVYDEPKMPWPKSLRNLINEPVVSIG